MEPHSARPPHDDDPAEAVEQAVDAVVEKVGEIVEHAPEPA